MNKTEARIQQEIVVWFRNNYCLKHHRPRCVIFSVPNERQSREERIRLFNTGMLAGVSDLIVVAEGVVLFVEVKDDTGRQSKEQLEFEQRVESLGYRYAVVRSVDEFQSEVERMMGSEETVKKC